MSDDVAFSVSKGCVVVRLGEIVMILELHRQGLSISAIARRVGLDRKTVRRSIARGLEPPRYGPRQQLGWWGFAFTGTSAPTQRLGWRRRIAGGRRGVGGAWLATRCG